MKILSVCFFLLVAAADGRQGQEEEQEQHLRGRNLWGHSQATEVKGHPSHPHQQDDAYDGPHHPHHPHHGGHHGHHNGKVTPRGRGHDQQHFLEDHPKNSNNNNKKKLPSKRPKHGNVTSMKNNSMTNSRSHHVGTHQETTSIANAKVKDDMASSGVSRMELEN